MKAETESKTTVFKEQLISTKFCLDKFKHSEGHFKFYTRFETYETLNTFYNFSGWSKYSCLSGFIVKY